MNDPLPESTTPSRDACAVGGCGSSGGLCPGVALFAAMLPGLLLVQLTGWEPILWITLLLVAPLLMVGPRRLRAGWTRWRGGHSASPAGTASSRKGGGA